MIAIHHHAKVFGSFWLKFQPSTCFFASNAAAIQVFGNNAGRTALLWSVNDIALKRTLSEASTGPDRSLDMRSITLDGLKNMSVTDLLQHLSRTLNDLTGYSSVEQLKSKVVDADNRLSRYRDELKVSKAAYEAKITARSALQKEMNHLLQRKSSWSELDVVRFTELYKEEHTVEAGEREAKQQYENAAQMVEKCQMELLTHIRERYNAEQLWSDKIRRAATWWTWGLMGLHFLSFVAVYAVIEPRKRAALQSFIASSLEDNMISTKQVLQESRVAAAAVQQSDASERLQTAEGSTPSTSGTSPSSSTAAKSSTRSKGSAWSKESATSDSSGSRSVVSGSMPSVQLENAVSTLTKLLSQLEDKQHVISQLQDKQRLVSQLESSQQALLEDGTGQQYAVVPPSPAQASKQPSTEPKMIEAKMIGAAALGGAIAGVVATAIFIFFSKSS